MTDQPVPALPVRAFDVISSEWIKIRSVRSNYWTLSIAALATIGITAIVARGIAAAQKTPAPSPITPLIQSFLGYAEYTIIPVSILGVLAFTSEYTTGLIQTTLTAVPRRWPLVLAKAAVIGAITLAAGELLAFAAFLLTQALIAHQGGMSLSTPGVLGSVIAAGVLLPACALIGLGVGAIVRHTAGAIAAALGVIYLAGLLCLLLPAPWADRIGRFTVAFAGYQIINGHPHAGLFSPTVSMLVLIAWPTVVLVAAGITITRRSA